MLRIAVLIDGGHLRVLSRQAGYHYDPDFIEKVAHASVDSSEVMWRALYHDCAPYTGKTSLPVSGLPKEFSGSDQWLKDLAKRNLFAVSAGRPKIS